MNLYLVFKLKPSKKIEITAQNITGTAGYSIKI